MPWLKALVAAAPHHLPGSYRTCHGCSAVDDVLDVLDVFVIVLDVFDIRDAQLG